MLEASTRRVTVEISWPEGKREQSIEIAQWLSKPQPGALADPDTEDAASSGGTATTGTTGDAR
jgi:general secretion pathway protein I